MKKVTARERDRIARTNVRLRKSGAARSGIRRLPHAIPPTLLPKRRSLQNKLYRTRKFDGRPTTVRIDGDLGIEERDGIDAFIKTARELLGSDARHLNLDLANCTRIWPSAITLLCSLKNWVDITAHPIARPVITSSSPHSEPVNSYLEHCGLYKYVDRSSADVGFRHQHAEMVEIERIYKKSNLMPVERAIANLIAKNSRFDSNQMEEFDDVVLTEIFANVSEHGHSTARGGWWALAQHHPTHRFVSLCLADNGIGVGNSLMTGPQEHELQKHLSKHNGRWHGGECIQLAMEQNVSGAIEASVKTGRFRKRHKVGDRRGNGLKRIRDTCKRLGVRFAILSHHGFVFVGSDGEFERIGHEDERVFGGTLYHFLIEC